MTKYQLTPNDGALAALDVAKARNEVLIDIPGSSRLRRLTVLNHTPDREQLPAKLSTPTRAEKPGWRSRIIIVAIRR
jgi:hypothetical protein